MTPEVYVFGTLNQHKYFPVVDVSTVDDYTIVMDSELIPYVVLSEKTITSFKLTFLNPPAKNFGRVLTLTNTTLADNNVDKLFIYLDTKNTENTLIMYGDQILYRNWGVVDNIVYITNMDSFEFTIQNPNDYDGSINYGTSFDAISTSPTKIVMKPNSNIKIETMYLINIVYNGTEYPIWVIYEPIATGRSYSSGYSQAYK